MLQEELKERAQQLTAKRTSRSHRIAVFFARVWQQLFLGGKAERADFWQFVRCKLHRQPLTGCRQMQEFDRTQAAGRQLTADRCSAYSCGKHRRQVVILSRHPYYTSGGGQRGAQLANNFARMEYDVIYLYSENGFYNQHRDFIDGLPLHLCMDDLTPEGVAGLLTDCVLAVFEFPSAEFLPYLEIFQARGIRVVYEEIDNWASELGQQWYSAETRDAFLKKADVLVGTCHGLCTRMEQECGRPVTYLPNACDSSIFDPERTYPVPADLPQGQKIVLYYGHLAGSWQNWELLFHVADACPDCAFVLIGTGELETSLPIPPNVRLLGAKPQTELPGYLQHSDFALLHFRNCEVGKYVSPVKIFEYLSMRKPVLATGLPEIRSYPNVVMTETGEEWISAIQNGVTLEDVTNFNKENTWQMRCQALLSL